MSEFSSEVDRRKKIEPTPPESTPTKSIPPESNPPESRPKEWTVIHQECFDFCRGMGGYSDPALRQVLHASDFILTVFKITRFLAYREPNPRELVKGMLRKSLQMDGTESAMVAEALSGRGTSEHDYGTDLPAQQRGRSRERLCLPSRTTSERGSPVSGTNPIFTPLQQTQNSARTPRPRHRKRSSPSGTSPKRCKVVGRSFKDQIRDAQGSLMKCMSGGLYATWERVRNTVVEIATSRSVEDPVKLVEGNIIFWAELFGHWSADMFDSFLASVCAESTTITNHLIVSTTIMDLALPSSIDLVVAAYREQRTSMGTVPLSRYATYTLKASFYRHYKQLVDEAGTPDNDLHRCFKALNGGTAVGRAWSLVMNDFILFKHYGVPFTAKTPGATTARRRLKNEISQCHTYYLLEQAFGKGLFLLLPDRHLSFLEDKRVDIFRGVVSTIAKEMPKTVELCSKIFSFVVQPLLRGEKPTVKLGTKLYPSIRGRCFLEILATVDQSPSSAAPADRAESESGESAAGSSPELMDK